MLTPMAPTPSVATMDFPTFLTHLANGGRRATRDYSLDHGVDEAALVQYVNGAFSVYERMEIEAVISRCVWAREFLVHYLKEKRSVA